MHVVCGGLFLAPLILRGLLLELENPLVVVWPRFTSASIVYVCAHTHWAIGVVLAATTGARWWWWW